MTTMSGDLEEFSQLTSADLEQMISEHALMTEALGGVYGVQVHEPAVAYNQNGINSVLMETTPSHHPSSMANLVPAQPRPQSQMDQNQPWVEIIEQPRQRGLRFRYQCEGRFAGSIPGENSSNERKTFPTIKIHNYRGQAIIVVSCVTKDPDPRCKPHPHSLVGKDCKKGVCTLRVRDTSVISFPQLGIQCAKKKDVDDALKLRKDINVDPFQTGFDHSSSNIDLNVVRLCFQVFLPDTNGKVTRVVPPVVSLPIHDKKALNELIICRVDRSSGKVRGGDEVFLLCEKVNRDDIKVRFYEEESGRTTWEAFGDFGQGDVHRQYAIVFKTPKYKEEFISRPVNIKMQLYRPSDKEGSEPIQFTYMPEDPDPDRIEEKRRRKGDWLNRVMPSSGSSDGPSSSNSSVKECLRHKLRANRKIKQEPPMETDANGATALKGISISSQGSGSSLEPLSSTPSSSHNFILPDSSAQSSSISTNPSQPKIDMTNTIDANRLMQQLAQQQQEELQQPQLTAFQTSAMAGASSSSQTTSLDSLLNSLGGQHIASVMSTLDTNAIQSLLDQGISFSSGEGTSNGVADMSVLQGLNTGAGLQAEQIDPSELQQQQDFLEVQAALEALRKS